MTTDNVEPTTDKLRKRAELPAERVVLVPALTTQSRRVHRGQLVTLSCHAFSVRSIGRKGSPSAHPVLAC